MKIKYKNQIVVIGALCLCQLVVISCVTAQSGVIDNTSTPHMHLKTIGVNDCQWTEGFWADKVNVALESMIPNLGRLMGDPEIIHAYDNFKVAAGLKEGEFRGWAFHDGDFYKYVEALAYAYAMTKDKAIDQTMDEIISVIAQAQLPNGYLHTRKQIGHGIAGFHHESERRFSNKTKPFTKGPEHEFYNFGHLFTAACVHFRVTGKRNFLNIAIKSADLLYDEFIEPSPEKARIDWNPPHYMGLIELYRTTGDERYVDLVKSFVDMLGSAPKEFGDHRGMDHSQRTTPIREEYQAVGHAGHGNYLYSGIVDLYAETGDTTLLRAIDRIWENVTTKKMYLTGATGPHHFGTSKKAMVAEAYGLDYEMPNMNAYNETCANIGNAMWNWRMFLLEGDAKYMDLVELIFYNSALSGISLDGKQFFYTNPLRFIKGHAQNTKDHGRRNDFMSVFCCPPNIIRTIAKMHTYAYTTSDRGIWLNLYGSNTVTAKLGDNSMIGLTQRSNYPWEGSITVEVDEAPEKSISIFMRIPSWAETGSIKVNGKRLTRDIRGGFYEEINRNWKSGDIIELDLPLNPQLVSSNPNIEETRNQTAVKYGPLIYCLEATDIPADINIMDVVIPQDITFEPSYEADLLSGVVVLNGRALTLPNEKWGDQLYKPLTIKKAREIPIKLIPYFTWANRELSDMTVWMPLKY